MPRALAVLRLMTRSNLVACSMGRSLGFAPFTILSTEVADLRKRSGVFALYVTRPPAGPSCPYMAGRRPAAARPAMRHGQEADGHGADEGPSILGEEHLAHQPWARDVFSVTAARMSAFSAASSILSPS